MEPYVLSIIDAAKFIGLSRSRLYELVADGQIEVKKLGFRTVVRVSDLKAFVDRSPAKEKIA